MAREVDIPMGWPYPKRKQHLDQLTKSNQSKYQHQLKFQGKQQTFPVFTVEIDLPKYRLANGRTQAAQEEHLARNPDRPADFFTRDLENISAQEVQHHILWDMVQKTLVFDYFKNPSNTQDQPFILTHDGFVVNGNSRLCVMRELYYGDQGKYARYAHVDIIILPFCSPRDIDELEAQLQIEPDIKQDYTWISLACMLRARQHEHHYTGAELAKLFNMTEKEVQATLARLTEVDSYLASRGKAKQYNVVSQDEFAFKQLQKARQILKKPDEQDLFTQISYIFIDGNPNIKGRLYENIPGVKDNLLEIVEKLSDELDVKPAATNNVSQYDIFGGEHTETDLTPLVEAVSDKANHERVLDVAIDVIESKKEQERQRMKLNAVLKQVSEANTHLINAVNYLSEDTSKMGIEEHLCSIEASIQTIREWLADNA